MKIALSFMCLTLAGCSYVLGDQALTTGERIVALTILGEARGEGQRGMHAVACVIQQRAKERKLSPARVCLQPWQFSIWNAGKGKVKKESELYYLWKSKHTSYAREIARKVCSDSLKVGSVGSANHYYSKKELSQPPYWAKDKTPVKTIGNHIFYRLK